MKLLSTLALLVSFLATNVALACKDANQAPRYAKTAASRGTATKKPGSDSAIGG